MPRLSFVLLSLSLAACARGTIDLGEGDDDGGSDTGAITQDGGASSSDGGAGDGGAGDGGAGDGGAGDGGSPGGDGGGSTGDGGGSPDFGGRYVGVLTVTASSDWGDYDIGSCEIDAEVLPEGLLEGTGPCEAYGYGSADAQLSGMVDPDGMISGMVLLDIGGYAPDFPLEGATDGVTMSLHFEGEAGYGTDLIGDGELLRE